MCKRSRRPSGAESDAAETEGRELQLPGAAFARHAGRIEGPGKTVSGIQRGRDGRSAEEPPAHPATIDGTKTQFVELGSKGKYAIVLGLFDDGKTLSVRDQRVPLDARFGESPRMKQMLAAYQDQLKESGLEGLGLKPTAKGDGRSKFVGSKVCGDCHSKAFAIWKKTPHAKAL